MFQSLPSTSNVEALPRRYEMVLYGKSSHTRRDAH